MQRITLVLALLALGCGDTHQIETENLPDVDGGEPVTVTPDVDPTSLIPEVASAHPTSLIPEVTDPALPELTPPAIDDGIAEVETPDYDTLRGATVTVREVGPWVLRSSGGGSSSHGRTELGYDFDDEGGMVAEISWMPPPAPPAAPSRVKKETRRPSLASSPAPAPDMADISGSAGVLGGGYVAPPAGDPLKAGTTDDNESFGEYLEFLATWTDRAGMAGSYVPTDVRDRAYVQVVDRTGIPLPGAQVEVSIDGEFSLVGSTYGDGTVPFFPHLEHADASVASEGYTVRVRHGGERIVVPWSGQDTLQVRMDQRVPASEVVPLDVVFLIDTTGSMSDEIDRIKTTLLSVTEQIRAQDRPVDLRYGAVLYRDLGDEYVTKRHPFTTDIQAFDGAIQGIRADGGGDGPESLNQGLAETVHAMEWRNTSAKVVFLVADAPPHMDYQGDVTYAETAQAAVDKGIRVHTVAASGLDSYGGSGSLIYRQTAQLTQGRFIFIEYGSTAASAASHGVTGPVKSNNLDDIVFEQVQEEIEGWRRLDGSIASR